MRLGRFFRSPDRNGRERLASCWHSLFMIFKILTGVLSTINYLFTDDRSVMKRVLVANVRSVHAVSGFSAGYLVGHQSLCCDSLTYHPYGLESTRRQEFFSRREQLGRWRSLSAWHASCRLVSWCRNISAHRGGFISIFVVVFCGGDGRSRQLFSKERSLLLCGGSWQQRAPASNRAVG